MPGKPYAKLLVERATGRPLPDVLRELYVDKRYTQGQVATALDVGRDTIIRWLAEYGIDRNERAEPESLVKM